MLPSSPSLAAPPRLEPTYEGLKRGMDVVGGVFTVPRFGAYL